MSFTLHGLMTEHPIREEPEIPHPSRLALDDPRRAQILVAHRAAIASGEPTYSDPATGLAVFTSAYLHARGTCCDTGCRHCPYLT